MGVRQHIKISVRKAALGSVYSSVVFLKFIGLIYHPIDTRKIWDVLLGHCSSYQFQHFNLTLNVCLNLIWVGAGIS